ncbi:hypothetical protein F2981_01600 [Sinorhizobium meliloti]|nr:hypothetical protein [Sinorhizobium meliloti]
MPAASASRTPGNHRASRTGALATGLNAGRPSWWRSGLSVALLGSGVCRPGLDRPARAPVPSFTMIATSPCWIRRFPTSPTIEGNWAPLCFSKPAATACAGPAAFHDGAA